MADDDSTTLQDLEEEQDARESTPPPETPAIQGAPAVPIENVSRETPAIAPVASGPLPAAGFRRTSAVPEAEQPVAIAGPASVAAIPFPGDQAPTPINPRVPPVAPTGATVAGNAVRQNPFAAMMSNEPAIHSPVARVLHKFAMMSPEIRQEEERKAEFAADQPYKQAQTEDIEQQVAQRKAETARMVGGQVPIDKPIPIYAAPGTPNAGEQVGEKGYDKYGQWHENMFPTGGAAAPAAGPAAGPAPGPVAGPSPTVATIPAGANSVPASAQTPPAAAAGPTSGPPARTTTTMKPQEPQRPPLATPAEAAKLAPVQDDAATYTKQIQGLLGKEAADYPVRPTDSREQAEKTLADARARATEIEKEKSAERAAGAPEAAQDRKDARTMGYAVDANGSLSYMSKADADKLHSTFEEVKPTEVNKDRQAIRQLNDVQQNVSRYRTAQNAIKENIPFSAASAMATILSDKNIGPKLEVFGVGIDTGQVNDVLKGTEKAALWNKLSDPQRDLVASYLRAKSSVIAYQKALTGIGRTNKEQLDIETDQLPTPYVGATVGNKQLDAFQENIDRATEGFPTNLPGLKSPAQVRAESEKPKEAAAPGPGSAKFHYAGGKGEIFSDDGKTWYDSAGKKVGK